MKTRSLIEYTLAVMPPLPSPQSKFAGMLANVISGDEEEDAVERELLQAQEAWLTAEWSLFSFLPNN